MISPMPFCPSLEPWKKLTSVQVRMRMPQNPPGRRLFALQFGVERRNADDANASTNTNALQPAGRKEEIGSDNRQLCLQECQQVGVNRVGLRRRHAVREILVGFQRAVFQQFCRQWSGSDIGNDLIVLAVHHQHRNGDLLQSIR